MHEQADKSRGARKARKLPQFLERLGNRAPRKLFGIGRKGAEEAKRCTGFVCGGKGLRGNGGFGEAHEGGFLSTCALPPQSLNCFPLLSFGLLLENHEKKTICFEERGGQGSSSAHILAGSRAGPLKSVRIARAQTICFIQMDTPLSLSFPCLAT